MSRKRIKVKKNKKKKKKKNKKKKKKKKKKGSPPLANSTMKIQFYPKKNIYIYIYISRKTIT